MGCSLFANLLDGYPKQAFLIFVKLVGAEEKCTWIGGKERCVCVCVCVVESRYGRWMRFDSVDRYDVT